MTRTLTLALVASLLSATPASSQSVATTINYQGRLTDNAPGQTPIDATLPITFSLWDAPSGGAQVWSESWPGVAIVNGIFSVILGTGGSPIPPGTFGSGAPRYVEIEIAGELLAPRQQLGSVAWSMHYERAATASTATNATNTTNAGSAFVAFDLSCSNCVDLSEVAFGYAGSASKGGPAMNLACADCVDASEVQFNYAGSLIEGGAAADLACIACAGDQDVADAVSIDNGRLYAPAGGGNVGIGTTSPISALEVRGVEARLYNPANTFGWGARLNFGDGNYVYAEEDADDKLTIRAGRIALLGGNVGIGTTTPTAPLHVQGNAHVQGDLTWKPKTSRVSVSPAAFTPIQGAAIEQHGTYVANQGSTYPLVPRAVAPIQLPDGATVVKVMVRYFAGRPMTGGELLRVVLERSNFAGTSESLADLTNPAGPAPGFATPLIETSISHPTIDNANYQYFVSLAVYDGGSQLWGLVIDYTTTGP